MNPIEKLRERLHTKKKTEPSPLSSMFDVAKEFGCVGDILGREFEIYDPQGNLQYTVKQKPMKVTQLAIITKELDILRKLQKEAMDAKTNKSPK